MKNNRAFFQQVRILDHKIQTLTYKIQSLESCLLPQAIRYDKDIVQTSLSDKMSEVVAEIRLLEKRIDLLRRKKAKAIRTISAAIETLSDEREKAVLTGYYLAQRSILEISEEMNYSIRQTYRFLDSGCGKLGTNGKKKYRIM